MSVPLRSFRLEMLQVARLAPKILGEATALVEQFFRSRLCDSGGFGDREGRADLYYTVFGLEGLLALQAGVDLAPTREFLRAKGDGAGLDFVHLCSLARCHANIVGDGLDAVTRDRLLQRIEAYRTPDGGYHGTPGKRMGSAYGALLASGAYVDLGGELDAPGRLLDSVLALRLPDGSFANEPDLPQGVTTATAAAASLCRHLGEGVTGATIEWLYRQQHESGGFLATPRAPLPDLLSTATALHALDTLEASLDPCRESCLDFIDTLWTAEGGFHGHWADDDLDVEYTSYGLLALGHLA